MCWKDRAPMNSVSVKKVLICFTNGHIHNTCSLKWQNHYYTPKQRPEIMDVEMHHSSSDFDEGWVQPWRHDGSNRKVLAAPPRYVES